MKNTCSFEYLANQISELKDFFLSKKQKLETLLPARDKVDIPVGEHVEEVNLMDYEPRQGGSGRKEAYDEDSDDDQGAGPRVQCAHQ